MQPFPAGEPEETARTPPDPLEMDWSEGLRAPLRETALPKPRRLGIQSAPAALAITTAAPAAGTGAAEPSALMTEQLDLSALEQLRVLQPEPAKEPAAEVEAPEAWASAEEDQLASVPPPPKDAPKEEVLLLSDAELAHDGDAPADLAPAKSSTAAPWEAQPLLELGALDRAPADPVVSELEAALAAIAEGADPEELGILPASEAHAAIPFAPAAAEPRPVPAAAEVTPTRAALEAHAAPLPELEPEPALRGAAPIEPLARDAPHDDELHDLLAQIGAHTPAKGSTAAAPRTTTAAPAAIPDPVREQPVHLREELAPAQLLDPHESADWDAAGLEVPEAIAFESTPGYLLPEAKLADAEEQPAAKATHIDALDAHAAIDPWDANGSAHGEPAADAQIWSQPGVGGADEIDWAPALAPAGSAWDAPAAHAPEAASIPAANADWGNGPAEDDWQAATVHASVSELQASGAGNDAAWDSPDADWAQSRAQLTDSAPGKAAQPIDDSPFAPLPPGASLSGEDPNDLPAARPLGDSQPGALEPVPLDDQDLLVPLETHEPVSLALTGEHRVAVQTRGGAARRGILRDPDLTAEKLILYSATGQTGPEVIPAAEVKAVFFMLGPSEALQRGDGAHVRVTFVDGRTLEGERDGADAREGFFLVPIDAARTNTRRIFVARGALSQIEDG